MKKQQKMKAKGAIFPNLPKRDKRYTQYAIPMNDMKTRGNKLELYTLISLEEFKSILGIDDREDKLSRFCLITATHTIEQYCMRRLRMKTIWQVFTEWRDMTLFLNEYPVRKILQIRKGRLIKPELYTVIPDCGTDWDIPFEIRLSPDISRMKDIAALKVIYSAGYTSADVPADLKAACLELAAWNFSRYKSRRIGTITNDKVTSNTAGLELSLPENVRTLLDPYHRKTI